MKYLVLGCFLTGLVLGAATVQAPEKEEVIVDPPVEERTITHHHYATMMDDFVRELRQRNQANPTEYPR